jgi:hypothetical protein
MKNLSDIKRAMVLGSTWRAYHLGFFNGAPVKELGTRKIIIAQSNAIAFESKTSGQGSWLTWPKAKEVLFYADHPNRFGIKDETGHVMLVYERVENEQA